jgi:Lrp/AsnC family transcriptional regulator, leucine-responsive regulatory protein
MRQSGAIHREVALLDPRAAGVLITCVVLVTMVTRPRPFVHLDRVKQQMRELPAVQQCYQVTGSTDLVVVVSAASMEQYAEFARRWFERSEEVARYETLVVQDRVKVGLSLPVTIEETGPSFARARPKARTRKRSRSTTPSRP